MTLRSAFVWGITVVRHSLTLIYYELLRVYMHLYAHLENLKNPSLQPASP